MCKDVFVGSFHMILLVRMGSSQSGSLAAVSLMFFIENRLRWVIARGFRRQAVVLR